MASAKVVIRQKENKDGTYPLALRIIKNRKTAYIYLGKHVHKKDWNSTLNLAKRSHPNSKNLNAFIVKKIAEVNDLMLQYELQNKDLTLQALKSALSNKGKLDSFFEYAEAYLENLKQVGNYNRYSADRPAISHFRRFLKDQDIAFIDIKMSTLDGFEIHLKKQKRANHKKNVTKKTPLSERTIFNYLMVIRTLYKRAIKDEIVDKKHDPFGKDKFNIKKPNPQKIGLSEEDVKRIEALNLPSDSYEHLARNIWLYSFYFAGMRISDVLRSRWSDFKNGRLNYKMGKTNDNVSLKISQKAKDILDQYRKEKKHKNDFIFPGLKIIEDFSDKGRVQRRIKEVNRQINKALKNVATKADITIPLTMHIARHSFGNISGDKISIQMLQKLYRHSSITTTVNYQNNFRFKEADDALDSVLDF